MWATAVTTSSQSVKLSPWIVFGDCQPLLLYQLIVCPSWGNQSQQDLDWFNILPCGNKKDCDGNNLLSVKSVSLLLSSFTASHSLIGIRTDFSSTDFYLLSSFQIYHSLYKMLMNFLISRLTYCLLIINLHEFSWLKEMDWNMNFQKENVCLRYLPK